MVLSTRTKIAMGVALLTPYLARLPGTLVLGAWWLTGYFPGVIGSIFFAALALIPGIVLAVLGRTQQVSRLPFRLAVATMFATLFALHATLDLSSDSTAVVALVTFPILAAVTTIAGWAVGVFVLWISSKKG